MQQDRARHTASIKVRKPPRADLLMDCSRAGSKRMMSVPDRGRIAKVVGTRSVA